MAEHARRRVHRKLAIEDVHIGPAHPAQGDFDQRLARSQGRHGQTLDLQIGAAMPYGAGLLSWSHRGDGHATIVTSSVLQRKMTDEEALAAALADDLDAHFEHLVRVFQDRLYGFALRLTRSPQDAEESTQDTFVRAYRALEKYDDRAAADAAAQAVAVSDRAERSAQPRASARPEGTADRRRGDDVADERRGRTEPEAFALAAERHRELERLVAELPERYGTAVVLRHVQGLSYAEAAEVLDQPVGTTKSDVHRGLRLLREALDDREPQLAGLAGGR